MFGIEAGTQRNFHKPPSRLTMEESVRLAAVIPSPLRRRFTDDNDYVKKPKASQTHVHPLSPFLSPSFFLKKREEGDLKFFI